jgi:hypothetical protein
MKFLIKFFAVVISLFQINFTAAQSSSCTWGATFGGLSGALGTKHILDNSGNSILFGGFAGKIYLDPKKNSTFLQSTMGSDFLIKLNKKGDLIWKKELGVWNKSSEKRIFLGENNSIYLIAKHFKDYNYDPSSSGNIFSKNGVFIMKLDSNGNLQWVNSISESLKGYVDDMRDGLDLSIDKNYNVLITGSFWGSVDFAPYIQDSFKLVSSGKRDAFVLKLNKKGTVLWVKSFGGVNENTFGQQIATDDSGSIYCMGSYSGIIDIDPSPSKITNLTSGSSTNYNASQLYLCKLDSDGNLKWAKNWANKNDNPSYIRTLIVYAKNIYFAGDLYGEYTYTDGTKLIATNSTVGIGSINASGGLAWSKTIASYNVYCGGMAIVDDNIFLTGMFGGFIDFAPNINGGNHQSVGGDVYLLVLNNVGEFKNSFTIGGNYNEFGQEIQVGNNNFIYINGKFNSDSLNLDFESKKDSKMSFRRSSIDYRNEDAFLVKFHYFPVELTYDNVKCFGEFNGQVTVNNPKGLNDSQYLWSNGKNSAKIVNLTKGYYSVKIKDNLGCEKSSGVEITQPSEIKVAVSSTNTRCSGPCNGTLAVSASGGVAPYKYQWDSKALNQTNPSISNLCHQEYAVEIKDSIGCIKSISTKIQVEQSKFDPNVYLTNIAAIDKNNVSPAVSKFYTYNLPISITPPPSNPRNFVDPGKVARFKVECSNNKSSGQSIVSGICKVRSNSKYITIRDSSSALNNIGWSDKAWSADEFEIYIDSNTPSGTNACIDFIVQENGNNYSTTCIAIPIRPLDYSQTTELTIDDDNNPDSKGNDDNLCQAKETIEFYPWLNNISSLNAQYVRGRFENLENHSFIDIWNNKQGLNTVVYNETWWNYSFAKPQIIPAQQTNSTPEFDFVFDVNDKFKLPSAFNLHLVMAGGFKLFNSEALSLVQWSLPYSFKTVASLSNPQGLNFNYDIKIYPNPTNGSITVIKPKNENSKVGYKIINKLGTVVNSGVLINQNTIINLGNLNSGIYYFQIDNNTQLSKCFIKI